MDKVCYPEYWTHDHIDVPTDGQVSINILTLYFFLGRMWLFNGRRGTNNSHGDDAGQLMDSGQ